MKYVKFGAILFTTVMLVTGCTLSYKETPPVAPPAQTQAPEIGTQVEVFFGTNRKLISNSESLIDYGSDRSTNLDLGSCIVSIPPVHTPGEIERPWFKWSYQDPRKHLMIVDYEKFQTFEQVSNEINNRPGEKMFLFIHGYNVEFEEAAWRTAQIAYDMKFDGTPIFFSWPSGGLLRTYAMDEESINLSTPYIQKFIENLLVNSPNKDLYVIAHSMGARGASEAIKDLLLAEPKYAGRIKELIMAAPDINAEIYKEQIAPFLSNDELPVTIYTAANDRALQFSSFLHNYLRVGMGYSGTNNVEVVDATEANIGFLGHSYFSEQILVLQDIGELVLNRKRASEREKLKKNDLAEGNFWVLQP